ncbi:MAG: LCP family protein [Anaerolineales bacterium]|jgi:LCP family protein required for cell wall assembly
MRNLNRIPLFILLFALLAGCIPISALGMPAEVPVAVNAATGSPTPMLNLVTVPPNATATPTPFQPLPPTAVYLPTNTPIPTFTPLPPTPTFSPQPPAGNSSLQQPNGQMNILLLGSDQRPWNTNFRTDTIILATLNPELGRVNLTSFPRDLYLMLPGYGMQRINTAYEFGGIKMLYNTFEKNFGVRPDHYVLINFSSFKQVIDSLGGLDVNVAQTVSDYRNGRWYTVRAGMVHMNADDVLWYVRTRKTTNDFARSRRQQEVLDALFNKMLSINALKRVPELYAAYHNSVKTDLGFTDIVRLLPFAAKITESSQIHSYFIGPGQTYDWITPDGGMVLLPRKDAIQAVLRKSLNVGR